MEAIKAANLNPKFRDEVAGLMNNYDFAAADLPIIEKLIKRAKDNKR